MNKPLKPWCSFTEQLALLQARGMQVDDAAAALDHLERIGYYRLSGYWYPLRAMDHAWPAALNNARPFFYFCLMKQLLDVICPRSTWAQRVADLLTTEFPHTQSRQWSLDDMGTFNGWADALPWKQQAHK